MNCHVLIHGAPNRARSVLAQIIGRASLRATVAAIDAPVQRAADKQSLLRPLAGFAGIDQVYGLAALQGDEVAYAGLLFHLAIAHRDDVQGMRAAVVQGQIDHARSLAHALTGTAATLGVTSVQMAASAVSLALRSGSVPDDLPARLDALLAQQRAEALDQRDRAAVGLVGRATGLTEQVACDHAVHHLQHGRHQPGLCGQQRAQWNGRSKHPLARRRMGDDVVHQVRGGLRHAASAA